MNYSVANKFIAILSYDYHHSFIIEYVVVECICVNKYDKLIDMTNKFNVYWSKTTSFIVLKLKLILNEKTIQSYSHMNNINIKSKETKLTVLLLLKWAVI